MGSMALWMVSVAAIAELACIIWLVQCNSAERDRVEELTSERRRAYAALAEIANRDHSGLGGQMAHAAIRNASARSVDDHMALMGITRGDPR